MSTVKVIPEQSSWSFSSDSSSASNVIHEKNDLTNISEETIYLIIFFSSISYFLYTFLKGKT